MNSIHSRRLEETDFWMANRLMTLLTQESIGLECELRPDRMKDVSSVLENLSLSTLFDDAKSLHHNPSHYCAPSGYSADAIEG